MSEIYDAKLRSDRVLLDLVGDKWTVLVFGSLCDHGGRRRFNAIRRDIPGISQKSLTQCLRRLERNGLVRRDVHTSAGRLAVEYAFTQLGDTLDGPVGALLAWTAVNADAVRRSQAEFDRSGNLDEAEKGLSVP